MEHDSKPRMYSPLGEKFVSETSVDSNCEKKAEAASGNQTKYSRSFSHKTAESVKIQNLLVIQVNYNMIWFPCYCLLVHL